VASITNRTAIRREVPLSFILSMQGSDTESVITKGKKKITISKKSFSFTMEQPELEELVVNHFFENDEESFNNLLLRIKIESEILKLSAYLFRVNLTYLDGTTQNNAQKLDKLTFLSLIKTKKIKQVKLIFMFNILTYGQIEILNKIC
jgi:hypothetical protein